MLRKFCSDKQVHIIDTNNCMVLLNIGTYYFKILHLLGHLIVAEFLYVNYCY